MLECHLANRLDLHLTAATPGDLLQRKFVRTRTCMMNSKTTSLLPSFDLKDEVNRSSFVTVNRCKVASASIGITILMPLNPSCRNITTFLPPSGFMPSRMSLRPLGLVKQASIHRQPYRCFSCTISRAQGQTTKQQDGKTTHFGFETVPESEKEAKGSCSIQPGLNRGSS